MTLAQTIDLLKLYVKPEVVKALEMQLQGFAERLTDELKVRVWVAEDPMTCVARGAGHILEDLEHLKKFLVGLDRGSTSH